MARKAKKQKPEAARRSDTVTLIRALREISLWCEARAVSAAEDADYWGHIIRMEALAEAADRLQEMHDASTS